jgi:hypothetical protein
MESNEVRHSWHESSLFIISLRNILMAFPYVVESESTALTVPPKDQSGRTPCGSMWLVHAQALVSHFFADFLPESS